MPVAGLNEPCGSCGRVSGDHTLREWSHCLGTPTLDLPYAELPPDAAELAAASVRERFNLDDDWLVADHVVVKAATLEGASGPLRVAVPALIHEFGIGVPGQLPSIVAKVVFLGDTSSMRAYGRLVRDSANGAANASELAA